MTTPIAPAAAQTSPVSTPTTYTHQRTPYSNQTLTRAIHSEWIKLRTLRTTWFGLASILLLLIGLGAVSAATSTGGSATAGGDFGVGDPLTIALTGADPAVLLIGILGALAGSREYASRMISATVTSIPRRWQVVTAKSIALTGAVAVTALVGVFGAYGAGMGVLAAGNAPTVALTDSGVLGDLFGMVGYLSAIALIGLGLGMFLRSVAASIGTLFGLVILLPAIAGALLPASWNQVLEYLPSSAGAAFTISPAGEAVLGATAGILVLAGWVAAVLTAAVVTITRRDV